MPLGFWEAVFLIVGTQIGAGVLSLPQAFASLGSFWTTVILLLSYIFSLVTALLVLEALKLTDPRAHLFSLSKQLLGAFGVLLVLSIIFASYGALTAYIAGLSSTVAKVIPLEKDILAFVIWFSLSVLVYMGLKISGRAEQWMGTLLLLLFLLIILATLPHSSIYPGKLSPWAAGAFQVAMFAFFAHTVVPEVYKGLGSFWKAFKAIIVGFTITALIYIAFTLSVAGALGGEISEDVATNALASILPPLFLPFLLLLPILTMTTSFIGVGTGQKDMLKEIFGDLGPIIALLPPIIVYYAIPSFFENIFLASFGLMVAGGILPPLLTLAARRKTGKKILPVSDGYILLVLVIMCGIFIFNVLQGWV